MSKPRGSGQSWQQRQARDQYVQKARREGWRSRAVYKLAQIADKEKFLRPNITCIDLGAAPGSWSQYVSERLKGRSTIIALDILPMDDLPDVQFLQGDFTDNEVVQRLLTMLQGSKADLVMSDIAPNITGNKVVDQPRSMYLAELALDLAKMTLKSNGSFVCKVFQGAGSDAFVGEVRCAFNKVKVVKPKASRDASREVYVVARGFNA